MEANRPFYRRSILTVLCVALGLLGSAGAGWLVPQLTNFQQGFAAGLLAGTIVWLCVFQRRS